MLSAKFILASVAFCLGVLFTGCSKDDSNEKCDYGMGEYVNCDDITAQVQKIPSLSGITFTCEPSDLTGYNQCLPQGDGASTCATDGSCPDGQSPINFGDGTCFCTSLSGLTTCTTTANCASGQTCETISAAGGSYGICVWCCPSCMALQLLPLTTIFQPNFNLISWHVITYLRAWTVILIFFNFWFWRRRIGHLIHFNDFLSSFDFFD